MHEETEHVEPQTICVPLVLDCFLYAACIEHLNLFCILEDGDKRHVFIDYMLGLPAILILYHLNILAETRYEVDGVFNFVNWCTFDVLAINRLKILLREYFSVLTKQSEKAAIVRSDFVGVIGVIRRPFIVVNRNLENVRLMILHLAKFIRFIANQFVNIDSFFHHVGQVLAEQVTGYEVVLVLADIIYHEIDCFDLIILQSIVDCCVVKVTLFLVSLWNLCSINHRVFRIKKFWVIITQKVLHRSTIKRQYWNHIRSVQL